MIVRVVNWYPSGNSRTYSVTPTFVDNVPPVATVSQPHANATEVSRFVVPVVKFSEAVSGVSGASVQLRDLGTDLIVPATLTYDQYAHEARIVPTEKLRAERPFRVEVSSAIKDAAGVSVIYTPVTFSTNAASFTDTHGTTFAYAIEWLLASGITFGCTEDAFCPTQEVSREQMAGFLSRALDLADAGTDYFTDDEGRVLEDRINQVAAAGLTKGCTATRFCPTKIVTASPDGELPGACTESARHRRGLLR